MCDVGTPSPEAKALAIPVSLSQTQPIRGKHFLLSIFSCVQCLLRKSEPGSLGLPGLLPFIALEVLLSSESKNSQCLPLSAHAVSRGHGVRPRQLFLMLPQPENRD